MAPLCRLVAVAAAVLTILGTTSYLATAPSHATDDSIRARPLTDSQVSTDRQFGFDRRRLQASGGSPEGSSHKGFMSLSWGDVLGLLGATCGLLLAAGGGIGGGGILVPIFILVMGFEPKYAIPLSNVTVFGGAVANTLLNLRKRHPYADRPLIDFELILVMEPLTIAGALFGALANKVLPELFIVVMLVLLLSFTAYSTLNKACKMHENESLGWSKVETKDDSNDLELVFFSGLERPKFGLTRRRRSDGFWVTQKITTGLVFPSRRCSWPSLDQNVENTKQNFVPDSQWDSGESPLSPFEGVNYIEFPISDIPIDDAENESEQPQKQQGGLENIGYEKTSLAKIMKEEQHMPTFAIVIVTGLFVVVLLINILKGGGAFPSPVGIECGSASYWAAEGFILSWIVVTTWYARSLLIKRTSVKDELRYEYVEGDIKWDGRALCVYPSVSCLAGLCAGMFGIGGGVVKGPLMLAMGVHPTIASATSACMILFTSFTATTSFILYGLLIADYAWFCLVMGFVATMVGQIVMTGLLRRYKRNSYIAFCIGIVVLLSAFFMTIESLVAIRAYDVRSSVDLCSSH